MPTQAQYDAATTAIVRLANQIIAAKFPVAAWFVSKDTIETMAAEAAKVAVDAALQEKLR